MIRFKRCRRGIIFMIALFVTFSAFNIPAYAAENDGQTTQETELLHLMPEELEAGKQFYFKGMPYNGKNSPIKKYNGKKIKPGTIQNFAYTPDGKYVFTTGEGKVGSTRHTILSRCRYPSKIGASSKALFIQGHVLGGYGHGETIDITQPDLKKEVYHIWVATKPTGGFYGLQIARLTYVVDDGVGEITNVVRLTNFCKTNYNKKGKPARFEDSKYGKYYAKRVNVSVDTDNNQIAFRIEFTNDQTRYVIYDYKKINKALNKLENGQTLDMKTALKWQVANIKFNSVPYRTFQSFCISDNTVYLAGGYLKMGAKIYMFKYKPHKKGKLKTQAIGKSKIKTIINIIPQLTVKKTQLGVNELEIEGLKVYKDKHGNPNMYINFYQKDIPITSSIGVYKFSLSQTITQNELDDLREQKRQEEERKRQEEEERKRQEEEQKKLEEQQKQEEEQKKLEEEQKQQEEQQQQQEQEQSSEGQQEQTSEEQQAEQTTEDQQAEQTTEEQSTEQQTSDAA